MLGLHRRRRTGTSPPSLILRNSPVRLRRQACRRGQLFEEFEGTAREVNHVASARAHGMIRADYSDVVRKALQGEVGKDLVKLPVYEIVKQLLLSGAAR
jgi:protein required for attachment to host cells